MRAATQTGGRDATRRRISGDFALCVGDPVLPAPPGWRWYKLTDVARLESGHTPSRKHPEYWGGDIPWITLSDARAHDGGVIFDTIEQTNELGIANSSARMLPVGTVCLSRTASVGYVVVTGKPMATSQDFVNWVCSEQLDPHFLRYLLIAERSSLGRFSSGAVHQTIYFPEVKAFHVCLPPVDKQKRIVGILDTAFDGIGIATANAEKSLANARELFEVALNNHFDAPSGPNLRLDEVCTIISPLVDPRDSKYRDLPHIGAGNIESKTGRLRNVLTAQEEGLKSGKFPFDDRMVLYSKIRPYLEKVARPDFAGLCSADMYPLLPSEGIITRAYLYYLLRSPRFTRYAIVGSARAGMPKVNREHLFAFSFQLPPIEVQRRISDLLDAVGDDADRLIALQCARLSELVLLKQSILARAFSGRLPVTSPARLVDTRSAIFGANVIALAHAAHLLAERAHTFGTVKAQKHLHMVEEITAIDLGRDPIKDAAGPNDPEHFQRVRSCAEERGFFKFDKRPGGGHTFRKLPNYTALLADAKRDLAPYLDGIDRVSRVLVLMDKVEAEVLATVYAAWSNLLLDGTEATREAIVRAAREDWHADKLSIERKRFFDAIKVLRREKMVPTGAGKRVREKHSLI